MRNKFAGPCKDCGMRVEAGAGYFEKQREGGWKTRHILCTARGLSAKGLSIDAMSYDQRAALHESRNRA